MVGTLPDLPNTLNPQACLETSACGKEGFRQVLYDANSGVDRTHVITDLLPGVYFWSVQAIDIGGAASAFAPYAVFSIDPRSNAVELTGTDTPAGKVFTDTNTTDDLDDVNWYKVPVAYPDSVITATISNLTHDYDLYMFAPLDCWAIPAC